MRLPWEMNRLPGQLRADLQDRLLGSLCKAGIAQIAGIVCQHMSRYVNNGTCLKCHAAMLARTSIRQKVWTCKPLVMDIPLTSLPKVFVFFVIDVLCRQGFGSSRGYRSPPRMEDLRQGARWNGWNGISRSKIPRDPENS